MEPLPLVAHSQADVDLTGPAMGLRAARSVGLEQPLPTCGGIQIREERWS
jgi:hypothetical protein